MRRVRTRQRTAVRLAAAAVVGGGSDVDLAAVGGFAIAVCRSRVAGEDSTGSLVAEGSSDVRSRTAARVATAATVDVGEEINLAAVGGAAIAVGAVGLAGDVAGPALAHSIEDTSLVAVGAAGVTARGGVHQIDLATVGVDAIAVTVAFEALNLAVSGRAGRRGNARLHAGRTA